MENFIKEVMRILHEGWPGLLSAMDVVNEAVNEDGSDRAANNEWYTTFGDNSYVSKAFEFARKYSVQYGETQMKLYYNDYNTHVSAKADGIVALCKPIFDAGHLDGIGMQDHDAYNSPSAQQWIASYDKFSSACSEIAVTELDVRPSSNDLTSAVLTSQANQYSMLFKCFLDRSYRSGRGKVISVTKDGLNDELAFVANASLWDRQNQCKPAFYEVAAMAENYHALDTLIDYAGGLVESEYEASQWLAFSNALASAKKAMNENYSNSVSTAGVLSTARAKLFTSIAIMTGLAVTSVEEENPAGILLGQNYPNPFRSTTTIDISLPVVKNVQLILYNREGRIISRLINGSLSQGHHQVDLNASTLPDGIYFYSLITDSVVKVKKMVIEKR
jgi:hypothetical protein